MIKTCLFGVFRDFASDIEAERFYIRFHAPEILRTVGPWLTRFETFKAYEPPPEARRWGAVASFYTELWWRNLEEYSEAGLFKTRYSSPLSVKQAFRSGPIPFSICSVKPTEDLLGKAPPLPEEIPILRWVRIIKYAEGIHFEDAEKWYLESYSQGLKQQPGLLRYISYRCIKPSPIPGDGWHRIEELWYQDVDTWRKANLEFSYCGSMPPWDKNTEPFFEMESTFLRTRPTFDWLHDKPVSP